MTADGEPLFLKSHGSANSGHYLTTSHLLAAFPRTSISRGCQELFKKYAILKILAGGEISPILPSRLSARTEQQLRHNHGYETPKQALEAFSAVSCGVLNPPPSAGLFDFQIFMRFSLKI